MIIIDGSSFNEQGRRYFPSSWMVECFRAVVGAADDDDVVIATINHDVDGC